MRPISLDDAGGERPERREILTIVVTGPPRLMVGGQARHVQMLEEVSRRLGYQLIHVEIGRRDGETGGLRKIRRMVSDYLHFTRVLLRQRRLGSGPLIVHLNSSVQPASLLRETGFVLCARFARPDRTILQIHGSLLERPDDGRHLLRMLARMLVASVDRLVVLSSHQALAIGGAHANAACVAPNVVELRPLARVENDRPQSPLRLLYVGRLSEEKGLSLCVAAVVRLRERGHPVRMTVAGAGEYEASLVAMIEQSALQQAVTLLGPVPPESVRQLLLSHDLLLFPSLVPEGLPYVLLEALEAALPVVATVTSRSVAEIVHCAAGAIEEAPADPCGFASTVERLALDAAARRRMGGLGRRAAATHYALAPAVDRWRKIWQPRQPVEENP